MHKVVLVIGVVGSGKTSLCRELGAELDALVLYEQAQEHGNPYIQDFYEEMPRWAFTLQIHQLATRYRQHSLAQWWVMNGSGHAVIDGGFWLDTCFARMIRRAGIMEEREFETYSTTFRSMTANVMLPTVVVRLDASPESALRRIASRATTCTERKSETSHVTLEYLTALDQEVAALCQELSAMGVEVIHSFWDEDRDTPEQRRQAVEGMARRVRGFEPPDPFLSAWRRRLG